MEGGEEGLREAPGLALLPPIDTSFVTFPKGLEAIVLAFAPHCPTLNVFCISLFLLVAFCYGREPSNEDLSVFRYVNVSVLKILSLSLFTIAPISSYNPSFTYNNLCFSFNLNIFVSVMFIQGLTI